MDKKYMKQIAKIDASRKVNKAPQHRGRISSGPSAERIIDKIIGYLTMATVLLILGLLIKDQYGFRGFTVGWLHESGYVRYESLISAFVELFVLCACAGFISDFIGRVKEPSMETPSVRSSNEMRRQTPEVETVVRPARVERAKPNRGNNNQRSILGIIIQVMGIFIAVTVMLVGCINSLM